MQHLKCKLCGNRYHWREAFSKFGFDDGEGKIQTILVGNALKNAAYEVSYFWWRPHNMIIYSIRKDGIKYMTNRNSGYCIGYTDPIEYLPIDILKLLEEEFPTKIIFR